jgi:hypothetical protein
MLITIGGTYDYVTHKQDPWISGVFTDNDLRPKVVASGIRHKYEGPVSIHTFLLKKRRKSNQGNKYWAMSSSFL